MPRINVLRPFVFTYPLTPTERVHREKFFAVGEHEIDEATASHPWIAAFADGRIESPAQEQARLEAAAQRAREAAAQADASLAAAQAAFARMVGGAAGSKLTAEELERAVNTPIPELRAAQGAAVSSELNTPVATLKLKSGPSAKSAA